MRWLLVCLLVLTACGGGDAPPANPPPNPLYVSSTGSDTNIGDQDAPLKSIRKAAQIALDDYEIIVAPGVYREEVTTDRTGTPAQGLTLRADLSGELTGTRAGAVIIDVTGLRNAAGISLSNSADTVIDGFTVRGSSDAGVVLKSGSDRATIRNCIAGDNPGDGLRVQDSAGVTLFNNLVYRNGDTGIVIAGQRFGSPDASVINNTVVFNGVRGVTIGTTGAASPRAFLRNNIVFENGAPNALQLRVLTDPRSEVGFSGDHDLVSPANYDPPGLIGANDISADPRFADPAADDYHLAPASPAIDAGDNGIPASLVAQLRPRTTTGIAPDGGELDLGYHFLE